MPKLRRTKISQFMSLIPVPLEILYPEMGPGSANHSHDTDENTVIIFISTRDGAQKKE